MEIHSLPLKSTYAGIHTSTTHLALDHTLFCFLGHLFLSVMRERTSAITTLISSFPPVSTPFDKYPRKLALTSHPAQLTFPSLLRVFCPTPSHVSIHCWSPLFQCNWHIKGHSRPLNCHFNNFFSDFITFDLLNGLTKLSTQFPF